LNDFGRESVALVQFWLSHILDPDRLGVNLSVPLEVMNHRYFRLDLEPLVRSCLTRIPIAHSVAHF